MEPADGRRPQQYGQRDDPDTPLHDAPPGLRPSTRIVRRKLSSISVHDQPLNVESRPLGRARAPGPGPLL